VTHGGLQDARRFLFEGDDQAKGSIAMEVKKPCSGILSGPPGFLA